MLLFGLGKQILDNVNNSLPLFYAIE